MVDARLEAVDVSVAPYKNGIYSDGQHKRADRDTLNRYQKADQDDLHYGGTVGDGITITQGSLHTGYPPSAGTHDGYGCNDLSAADAGKKMLALAKVGCIYFYRTVADGFSGAHGHTVTTGNPGLAWLTRIQVTSFFSGRNGLANQGPFRLAPGVSQIPKMGVWNDPWHGQKPAPPADTWPGWSDWPGTSKTGWGEGQKSLYNLLASCAVGIRGYAGSYGPSIDQTWDAAAMKGLQRWQENHQPWAGHGFAETAWDALGHLPSIKHDQFDPSQIKQGQPSHENYYVEMLLCLQGFAAELDQHAQITNRPHTTNAVKAFQKHVGITVDGFVGPVTWNKLWETKR